MKHFEDLPPNVVYDDCLLDHESVREDLTIILAEATRGEVSRAIRTLRYNGEKNTPAIARLRRRLKELRGVDVAPMFTGVPNSAGQPRDNDYSF